jgi:hypothetical protein
MKSENLLHRISDSGGLITTPLFLKPSPASTRVYGTANPSERQATEGIVTITGFCGGTAGKELTSTHLLRVSLLYPSIDHLSFFIFQSDVQLLSEGANSIISLEREPIVHFASFEMAGSAVLLQQRGNRVFECDRRLVLHNRRPSSRQCEHKECRGSKERNNRLSRHVAIFFRMGPRQGAPDLTNLQMSHHTRSHRIRLIGPQNKPA